MKISFVGRKPMLRKAVFLTPICVTRERMAKSPCKSRVFVNLADGILAESAVIVPKFLSTRGFFADGSIHSRQSGLAAHHTSFNRR